MAISLNLASSVFVCSNTRLVRMIEGDPKRAMHMGFLDSFLDIFRSESKREKVNELYQKLHNNDSDPILSCRNYSVNKLITFSKIRDLADFNKQDQFTVLVQDGKMDFLISGFSIYHQSISNFASRFIRCKCLFFDQTMREKEQLEILLKADKELAASKIQNFFRAHKRILEGKKKKAIRKGKEFAITKYKNKEGIKKKYYFHVNNEYPVVYSSGIKTDLSLVGSYKHVHTMDDRFVELVPNYNHEKGADFNRRNNIYYKELMSTKTVISGLVVDKDVIIARNAGEDLYDLVINKHQKIDIKAFREAMQDLKNLHQKGIYLVDIKIENMAYDKNKNRINLIDVENRVRRGEKFKGIIYSEDSATNGLLRGYTRINQEGKKTYDYGILRAWDEYAFLLAMIACTSKNYFLYEMVMKPDVDINGGRYPGAMNHLNKNLFNQWISLNVQSKFCLDIERLLTNPAKFCFEKPDHSYLADMFFRT